MKHVIIWGNHSSTQFPDVAHAYITCDGKQKSVYEAVGNDTWLKGDFIKVAKHDEVEIKIRDCCTVPFRPSRPEEEQ